MELQSISFKEACEFIKRHHRHHQPPQGWKFGMAVNDEYRVVGVATVGRPVSRILDDGWTLEVTKCFTVGTRNACSMLYSAAWRATKAMGYKRVITYILSSEAGTLLKAAGWRLIGEAGVGKWGRKNRPREVKAPTSQKLLWEAI